jgi:hypothetical protein
MSVNIENSVAIVKGGPYDGIHKWRTNIISINETPDYLYASFCVEEAFRKFKNNDKIMDTRICLVSPYKIMNSGDIPNPQLHYYSIENYEVINDSLISKWIYLGANIES